MKLSKTPTAEELQVISRFESLRSTLLSGRYANHLSKPLAYWALPSDRRLPLAFLGRTLSDLLGTPFPELIATPGIGQKKIRSFLKLLTRVVDTDPSELPSDGSDPHGNGKAVPSTEFGSNGFDPASVSEVVWSQWRASVLEHGLGKEPLGRFAPSLKNLTRVIWNKPLETYASYTLEQIRGRLEILPPKHARSPIALGDVWYHSWQAGGGYGDPLKREADRVAGDVLRGIVSAASALDIYGVVVDETGRSDASATATRRNAIRGARLGRAVVPIPGDAVIRFGGTGSRELFEVLKVDFDAGAVTCLDCGHVHCSPGDNLLSHLREVLDPLRSAGPVRGEDYDAGRFRLRQLCCSACGTLVDVQVALDGAPRPYFQIQSWAADS